MTIRVGVIGLNYGAQVHIPAYKANPKYEVVAVCARTPGRAEAVAQEHNIPRWHTDARELITSAEVELVSIASPPHTHSGYAAAAMAAGKHAVVEVAFAPSSRDARVLLDMAQDMQREAAPAYIFRYTPLLRRVSDLLSQNIIGRPRMMRFELFNNFLVRAGQDYRWIWDAENGGGILANYCAHALDLARRWFGPVREVDGTLATFSEVQVPDGGRPVADDSGFVTLFFENGVLATFSHSAVSAYPRTSIEVHGSNGSLLIEGFGDEAHLLPMGERETEPLFAPEAYLEETRGHSGLLGAFDVFINRLAGPLSGGPRPPDVPTIADGLEVTRIVDAVRLASRQRRRVRLDEIK